jgi:rhamnulokinase
MATLNLGVVDLGAESGRVFLARYDGTDLVLQEGHRFPNRPVQVHGHLHWNILSLWQEIVQSLRHARSNADILHSVGVDSWAIDYALLDANGFLLSNPFHYRDQRTEGIMEQVFQRVSQDEIYAATGIQFMPINTLYQLVAHRQQQPELFQSTGPYTNRLLLIPDLLHFWLSGEYSCERTNATTTQFWSVTEQHWMSDLLSMFDIPPTLMPPVIEPGTRIGPLLPALREEIGHDVQVIAPATHDTASAIAAIPTTETTGWAYISSGTWSLVGLELLHPAISQGHHSNFTNEGGIFGTVRFLKNVMGLWILQECRRFWQKAGQDYDYETLFAAAAREPGLVSFIDPDDATFLAPGDMPTRIRHYLAAHRQKPVESPGAMTRCILDSLILRYRQVLELAMSITGRELHAIYVVGGGTSNVQYNQWLADATGLPVILGPREATALGNALLQLVGFGELHTLADVRALATRAARPITLEPNPSQRNRWDDAYGHFCQST